MNRICTRVSDGLLISFQSGGDDNPDLMDARLDTLKQNALAVGYNEADIEVRWITDAEWAQIKADLDAQAIAAVEAMQAAKAQAIADALPSWARVSDACGNISTLAEAKAYLKKLSRVVYLLAKNQTD